MVKYFIENAVVPSHIEEDDNVLIRPTAFSMDVPWRANLVVAHRTHFLETPVGVIETQLALDNKRVVWDQVPMKDDLFVCIEFE